MRSPSAEGPAAGPALEAGPVRAAPAACASWALLKKELRAAFNSPVAYVAGIAFLALVGYFFATPLFVTNLSTLDTFTDIAPLWLLFLVPALTMRLYAEEYKSGTIELLGTLPVRSWEVLLAKFASACLVVAFTLAATAVFPVTIAALGRLDWGAAAGAYLGLWLASATLAAAGLFVSTLTRHQIVAFIGGFLLGVVFYILGKLQAWTPPWLSPLTNWLGFDSHLANLGRGVFDLRDLLYFASVTAFFLFTAHLATLRYRK